MPTGSSASPAPVGVPSSEQNNVSPYPVIERLGRWNGSEFVAVQPAQISGGTVIAMSHGWAPGFEAVYNQLQVDSEALVTFWNPGIADPATGVAAAKRFEELAAALQTADPDAQILMFSWIDQSATALDVFAAAAAERAAEVNGHRLATAIDEVLDDGFVDNGGRLHLIGHSFGANVAATAATAVSVTPMQLSLFDSPETGLARFGGAANTLQYKLIRLPVGRSGDEVFVDNYISEVGMPYGDQPGLSDVVDVRLLPPPGSSGADRHEFPIGWYAQSTSSTSAVGYRWSPLTGADPVTLGATYEQEQSDAPLVLSELAGPPSPLVRELVAAPYRPLAVASIRASESADVAAVLSGDDVTTSDLAFTTDDRSLWLDFDLSTRLSSGDSVSIYIDGRQRWFGTAAEPAASGSFVTLYDVEPGDHQLSIVLAGSDSISAPSGESQAVLSGLRIVSADDIVRNAETSQSRTVLYVVFAAVIVLAGTLLVVVAALLWSIVSRTRHARR